VADTLRILSSPVRLTGPLRLAHLSALVATDALLRRARAEGRDVAWEAGTLSGDLGAQHNTERELARQGQDRATLGRDAFVAEVRSLEQAARERVGGLLAALHVDADLTAGATDLDTVTRAARTAFVRLYEAGLLTRAERVVDTCPRCATVIDAPDAVPAAVDADAVVLGLALSGGESIEVTVVAPELLPGVVAVAVPAGHPAVGQMARLPLVGLDVPVIEGAEGAPALVVPAHDADAFELARLAGVLPVEVLDDEGTVVVDGPLAGMPRYAARAAAVELLQAEGMVLSTDVAVEEVHRCRRCSTVLVPRLGPHWFLAMADLEVAAADAVREGTVTFAPAGGAEIFLARAGAGGDWCLSHQVAAGEPVPVAVCLDCRQVAVSVELETSCGKCMGELVPDTSVLDARFVGAVWPLATCGWPDDEPAVADCAPVTTLLVSPSGIWKWALPMAGLGLRLAGHVPFSRVAVHDLATTPEDPDPDLPADIAALIEQEGARVVRTALVRGGLDLEFARAFVDALDEPPDGDAGIEELVDAYDAAFAAGRPGLAIGLVAAAVEEGVRPSAVDRIRALAAPILGD
jgi:valyl-tRNA synthetase